MMLIAVVSNREDEQKTLFYYNPNLMHALPFAIVGLKLCTIEY